MDQNEDKDFTPGVDLNNLDEQDDEETIEEEEKHADKSENVNEIEKLKAVSSERKSEELAVKIIVFLIVGERNAD
jgi:hypothetical protein